MTILDRSRDAGAAVGVAASRRSDMRQGSVAEQAEDNRLDVVLPAYLCGFAFVAPDVLGVAVWRRCRRYPGHDGPHSPEEDAS